LTIHEFNSTRHFLYTQQRDTLVCGGALLLWSWTGKHIDGIHSCWHSWYSGYNRRSGCRSCRRVRRVGEHHFCSGEHHAILVLMCAVAIILLYRGVDICFLCSTASAVQWCLGIRCIVSMQHLCFGPGHRSCRVWLIVIWFVLSIPGQCFVFIRPIARTNVLTSWRPIPVPSSTISFTLGQQ
jgi:hypothetical protein